MSPSSLTCLAFLVNRVIDAGPDRDLSFNETFDAASEHRLITLLVERYGTSLTSLGSRNGTPQTSSRWKPRFATPLPVSKAASVRPQAHSVASALSWTSSLKPSNANALTPKSKMRNPAFQGF